MLIPNQLNRMLTSSAGKMAVTPLVIRDANAKDSLFLSKLPGEMRNKIYRLALLDESVVVDYKAIHDKTALLRTSTQLREEASVIFYRESKFIVTNAPAQGPDLAKLLQAMGAENRHNIDKVVMQHKLPEVVSQRLKLLEDYCKSGLSMAAAAKKAAKDFGFSDDATFNDLLGSIYNNAIGPVKVSCNDFDVFHDVEFDGIVSHRAKKLILSSE